MAYSSNSVPTFWDKLSFPFSKVKKSKTLEDGPLGCPEASVRNKHYTPRNIPEERRSRLLRSGSLQSHIFICNTVFSRSQKCQKLGAAARDLWSYFHLNIKNTPTICYILHYYQSAHTFRLSLLQDCHR